MIDVSPDGEHRIAVSFTPSRDVAAIVENLPYAVQTSPGSWRVALCYESIATLTGLREQGLVRTDVEAVFGPASALHECRDGMLRPAPRSTAYPYTVWPGWKHHDDLIRLIPGGYRKEGTNVYSFPATSGGTIARLVADGVLSDPDRMIPRADALVGFDSRTGEMYATGDARVQAALDRFFPEKDIVDAARNHGVDVQFTDAFSEQVYRGELARHGEGIQPSGISVQLFPYQKQAVAQLLERDGLGVFLAPGLGKTLVAIAAGLEQLQRGMVQRVVICPPAAVSAQWEREIIRFTGTAPSNIVRVGGSKQDRAAAYSDARGAEWVIVHHDILDRDMANVKQIVPGALIVFDEAHRGANYRAKRSQRMAELAKTAARRVALTGTPVLNSVSEWFAVLGTLAIPRLFGSGKEFCGRYQYPAKHHSGYEGVRRLDELAERSRPHFIRWTKEQVATHLPPLQVRHMPVVADPEYRKLLVAAHVQAAEELSDHYDHIEDSEAVGQMTAYGMLRALCTSPMLLHRSESDGAKVLVGTGSVPKVDGPKVDTVRQIAKLMQSKGERVVMFTYSREMVKLLAERFTEDGTRFVTYHGETRDKDRDAAVLAFTTPGEEGPTVFLATDAAAEGLNLGHECSTLVNIDLPWTAGRLDQRFNRIHRVDGTHSSYLAVNMTLEGTVEDSILRKVEGKAGIADVLFGERSAAEITGRAKATVAQRAIQEAVREWDPQLAA